MKAVLLGCLGGVIGAAALVIVGLIVLVWVNSPHPPAGTSAGYVCVESWRYSTPMESLQYGQRRLERQWVSPSEVPQWNRYVVGRPGERLGWPCGKPPNTPFD
jgi:hypothetical protein